MAVLRALPLVALAALPAGLCGEDRVAILEAQRQELLEATVPKAEFWAQVERKGAAGKRLQALQEELDSLEAELAAVGPGAAPYEAAIAEAAEVNRRAEEVLADLRGRERELAERAEPIERLLAGWSAARERSEP